MTLAAADKLLLLPDTDLLLGGSIKPKEEPVDILDDGDGDTDTGTLPIVVTPDLSWMHMVADMKTEDEMKPLPAADHWRMISIPVADDDGQTAIDEDPLAAVADSTDNNRYR
jgi:hypothetical protein